MSNKTYFCKYLPVEGEIKMGDKFIDEGVMNMIGTRTNEEGVYDFQKVKLFLCSRDIQVGDKIKDENDLSQDLELNNEEYLRLYKEKGCTHHFKVIGEISPDATWVVENQEFEENEVQFWHQFELEKHGGFIVEPNIRPDWQSWVTGVKIKGACGHFH